MAKKPFDFWIFITVIILLLFGTIMIFSASGPYAYKYFHGDTYYFLKKQIFMAPVGLFAMFIMMNIDYKKLGKWTPYLLVGSIILLILVAIPGIGSEIKGSRRWLFGFQPSEFAKVAIIIFLSYSLSNKREKLKSFSQGLLPYLIITGIFAALMMLEPHLSGTIIIVVISVIILFVAGAQIKHFLLLSVPAAILLGGLIFSSSYRTARFLTFLNPFADPQGDGWQVVNSLYAIGSGGWFGKGLGRSLQKFLYIPEPQNDFILAILAEELGIVGVLVVLLLFLIFIWRGIKIALNAPDMFGCLLAIGITSLVAVQVVINVGVVTSSIPVTGQPLPFFSYGGTSLVIMMAAIGILLNISRYTKYERI